MNQPPHPPGQPRVDLAPVIECKVYDSSGPVETVESELNDLFALGFMVGFTIGDRIYLQRVTGYRQIEMPAVLGMQA